MRFHDANEHAVPGFHLLSGNRVRLLVPSAINAWVQPVSDSDSRVELPLRIPSLAVVDDPGDDEIVDSPFQDIVESIEVFSKESLALFDQRYKRFDSDTRERMRAAMEAVKRNDGRRSIPSLEPEVVGSICTALRGRFPNFGHVLDHLEPELLLAMASRPQAFRVGPILLYGAPGTGKTSFSSALARQLNIGFDRVSAAGTQGGFDLVGTSMHWGNSAPGRVLTLLADGDYATPVLLIDEIDKIADDTRYPVAPAVLELLEPCSAADFRDESLALRFDASHIIVIATANDIQNIPAPLMSRLHPIEVAAPTLEERRVIVRTMFMELVRDLVMEMDIAEDAIDKLAATPVDIRSVGRSLRQALGTVLMDRRITVTVRDVHLPKPKLSGIGFVV